MTIAATSDYTLPILKQNNTTKGGIMGTSDNNWKSCENQGLSMQEEEGLIHIERILGLYCI